MGINPSWIKDMKEQISEGHFESINLSYSVAIKWLVLYLANRNRPVKVVNLGAGVKRITLVDSVCEHCKGRGYE